MKFNLKRAVYENSPEILKKLITCIPFSLIAGRHYREVMARNAFFDSATREQIDLYQEISLRNMLKFATAQVPAYSEYKTVVERFSAKEALKAFPLLDKSIIQENLDLYLPRDFHKIPNYMITTGGTSGNQLKFYVDDCSQSVDTAFVHRLWGRVNYSPKKRKATFRGVKFPNLPGNIYWQHNPIYNELQFSPFHLSMITIEAYIEKIIDYDPSYLHGYPSAIDYIAKYILQKREKYRFKSIKAVFLVSEGFHSEQRHRIEEAFSCRVFSFYGHSERLVMGGECECSDVYHHFPDYGVLELIDDQGEACLKDGEKGEIVGTGLLNKSMPLIRYKTGDYATRRDYKCECGRQWDRFSDVKGRWNQEVILGNDGARVSIAALNMHGKIFENVLRYQYFQDKIGHFDLFVMVNDSFNESDRCAIENAYKRKIEGQLIINVKVVDDIPLTERGKNKLFVSRL